MPKSKIIIFIFYLSATAHFYIGSKDQLAVVIVPVADVTANIVNPNKIINSVYEQLPCSTTNNDDCLRAHQLLFNEVVRIIKTEKEQVKIEVFDTYYESESNKKINFFWTLKKNILNLSYLKNSKLINYIPKPYTSDQKSVNELVNQLVIKSPWYDKITKKCYSIGTNFVRCPSHDNESSFGVYLLDYQNIERGIIKKDISLIPKNICIIQYPPKFEDKVISAVKLLYEWSEKIGIVPYVLGGCSCTITYDCLNNYYENHDCKNGYWSLKNHKSPYTGFDCTGLILKAMQLNGIPYFFKNTSTLLTHLKSIDKNQTINSGDLIIFPGHVIVVGNIKKNEILEAAGFDAGYGKIQVIKLNKYFKSINNFSDLLFKYNNNIPIERLHKNGSILKRITRFKILKINSLNKPQSTA